MKQNFRIAVVLANDLLGEDSFFGGFTYVSAGKKHILRVNEHKAKLYAPEDPVSMEELTSDSERLVQREYNPRLTVVRIEMVAGTTLYAPKELEVLLMWLKSNDKTMPPVQASQVYQD